MVDEADDMIMAMEEGREVDILQEVMKYSGLEAEENTRFRVFFEFGPGNFGPKRPGGKTLLASLFLGGF